MKSFLIGYTEIYFDSDGFTYPDILDVLIDAENIEEAKSKFLSEHPTTETYKYFIEHIEECKDFMNF